MLNLSLISKNPNPRKGSYCMSDIFHRASAKISNATGKASAFIASVLIVIVWAGLGPIFGYSDTWQLVINTGTTIITFLMVFLIQNTQNRDSKSLHLKLDELIRAQKNASNAFLDLDNKTDEELDELQNHFAEMSKRVIGEKNERKQEQTHRRYLIFKDKSTKPKKAKK